VIREAGKSQELLRQQNWQNSEDNWIFRLKEGGTEKCFNSTNPIREYRIDEGIGYV
jgi:hypothetical protein